MVADDDTASEDRELYGDATPTDNEVPDSSKGAVEGTSPNSEVLDVKGEQTPVGVEVNALGEADAVKEEPKQEDAVEGAKSANGADETLFTNSSADPGAPEGGEIASKMENAPEDVGKDVPGEGAAEKESMEKAEGKDGSVKDDSDDESGDTEESGSEEDDDDDDDQDDFDVVLNCEDVDTTQRPGGPSFGGSIGKVRLPSNKWQRPGYVPPERVIGNVTQAGARPGGVLSMLPSPTMQIGISQKSVYDLEIGKLTEKPWLERGADLSDYFNYGFNEDTWKLYCERQMQMRLEASMLAKIKTVDGNKNTNAASNRTAPQVNQKNLQSQQNGGARVQASGTTPARSGVQIKVAAPPPPTGPGVPPPPPPPGLGVPPGALPGIPGMMKMPNMPSMPNMANMPKMPLPNMPNMPPFAFQPGMQNGKGGGFQPPFPHFPPMPNSQRQGDGKNANMFPFPFPGMPMPPGGLPPGGIPPGMGRGGTQGRGFPGHLQTPQNLQQQGSKGMRPQQAHSKSGLQDNAQGRGVKRQASDQASRFSAGGQGGPGKPSVHPSRQGLVQGHQPGQHRQGSNQGGQQDDDRRRWTSNRGMGDRRQGYERPGTERGGHSGGQSHGGGDQRGRSGYDERYGDRGHDRRRSGGWGDNREDGQERRRGGGGYDNQRYSDQRRDYDRDRDRDHYRKRGGSGRDYDDDRKRVRR